MKYIEHVLQNPEESFVILKALHDTVFKGEVPAKKVAHELGVDLGNLSTMCSPRSLEKGKPKFPLLYVPNLTELTGRTDVVEVLCMLCGGVFVKVSDINGEPLKDSLVEVKNLLYQVSDLIDTYLKAIEDGSITDKEFSEIEGKCLELVSKVLSLRECANILAY